MKERNITYVAPTYKLYNDSYFIKGELSNISGKIPGFVHIKKPEEFNYGIVDVVPVKDKTLNPPIIPIDKMQDSNFKLYTKKNMPFYEKAYN